MGLTSSPSLTTADVSLFLAAGLCAAGLLVFFPIRINGRSVTPACFSFLAAAECCLRVHRGACAGCFAALEVLHKLTVLMFTQHSTVILPNLAANWVDKNENKSSIMSCRHSHLCCQPPNLHRFTLFPFSLQINFILFICIIRILRQKINCPDIGRNESNQYSWV